MKDRSFDYVVIGAGAAGCVVAARLAEAGASVCLLEAGGAARHPLFAIPAGFARLLGPRRSWLPRVDWDYMTVPQAHLDGRMLRYPQAKVIGGGSSINAMIYTRGHPADYDNWARHGAAGWAYHDMLPYFRKAENSGLDPTYHGRSGPMSVNRVSSPLPISRAFVEAAVEAGIPANPDFNGGTQEGVGLHQVTISRGRRVSSATAYLSGSRDRFNLRILRGATVRRILFSGTRATGIEYRVGASKELNRVVASQEIICSAGAIGSAKLLQLSGIGPADHLRCRGVGVVANLPGVGSNLQDHFDVYLVMNCNGPHGLPGAVGPGTALQWAARYALRKSGPLASNFVEAGAFVRVDPTAVIPDVQFHLLPAYVVDSGHEKITGHGVSIYSNHLRPRSRGSVRLASADPESPPLIDPNFLADSYDLKMAIASLRRIRDIAAASPLRRLTSGERLPGMDVQSEDDMAAYVRRRGKTDFHPVGTCRIGDDGMAAVDTQLRVIGIERLRVVDASVMPRIIGGNTAAPIVAIAEKAAELILRSTGHSVYGSAVI